MLVRIKSRKDFWAGVLYITFGASAVFISQDYTFGTSARMGPGYFPTVLGVLLVTVGLAAVVRSFLRPGEPIARTSWKPLALISGATILFAILLPLAGLLLSLFVLIVVSAAASQHFRIDLRAAIGLVLLIAFCGIVFVKLLSVPMPLFGSLFGG